MGCRLRLQIPEWWSRSASLPLRCRTTPGTMVEQHLVSQAIHPLPQLALSELLSCLANSPCDFEATALLQTKTVPPAYERAGGVEKSAAIPRWTCSACFMYEEWGSGVQAEARNPLSGWFGHKAAFAFEQKYEPADGISRFQCGTPSILAMSGLEVRSERKQSSHQSFKVA